MLIEFSHITVPSRNLEASIAFYKMLGMHLVEHEVNHHAHFESKEHKAIFTIYYNNLKPDDEVKVYFEVDDLENVELRFRESVIDTEKIPSNWQGKELHLKDPDGNRVVLYKKFTAAVVPPWQQE